MTEDPEQRIAELERGVSGPAAGPDPAAAGAEPPRRTGLRVGFLMLGLLLFALAVGGATILTGQSQRTVPGAAVAAEPPPVRPTTATARPTRTGLPTPRPTVTPEVPVPPGGPPGTGGSLSVAGVDRTETIPCEGRDISVSGVDNTVVLTGRCGRVDVSGIHNSVRVDAAAEIEVSGMDNDVVYLSGDPRLQQSGLRNRLARG